MAERPGPYGRSSRLERTLRGSFLGLTLLILVLSAPTWLPGPLHPVGPPGARGPELATAVRPAGGVPLSNLSDVAMAYDAATQQVVAVADEPSNVSGAAGTLETWTFAGSAWSEASPTTAPPARLGTSLAYDPSDGAIVLFGGANASGYRNDLWAYSGGNWTNITPASGPAPSVRAGATFAWDASDGALVLFGGTGASPSTGLSTTWLFSSGAWSVASQGSGSTPPLGGAIATDPALGGLLYVAPPANGTLCGTTMTTWEFLHAHWTNQTTAISTSPPARRDPSLAIDPSTSMPVLFGGSGCLGPRNDTWTFGTQWAADTSGSSPTPRSGALFVADPAVSGAILFGGHAMTGARSDTYRYAQGTWQRLGPFLSIGGTLATPGGRVGDAGANLTVTVGGALTVGGGSFVYAGLPPACIAPDLASFRCQGSAEGNFTVTGTVSSATGSAPLPAVHLTLNPAVRIATLRVSPQATEPGVPVTVSVGATGGTGTYAYRFAGLPSGCASVDQENLSCTASTVGTYPIAVGVTDSVGGGATANVTVVVGPHPFIAAINATRPLVDVGQSTQFDVVAGGGAGPLSFLYTGLPGGCASANTTALLCSPADPGVFDVAANASDPFGFGGSAATPLTVHPRLTVASLRTNLSAGLVSNTTVRLGDSVLVSATVTGGTAPDRDAFSGLPIGCLGTNTTQVRCTVRATGTFTITFTVIDALGEGASATLHLEVAAPPPPTGPAHPTSGGHAASIGWLSSAELAGLIGGLVVAVAVATLFVRTGIQRNRRGRETVDGLLRESAWLGDTYGPIDDPTRPH